MPSLPDLIREYSELLEQEQFLERRKESLRAQIQKAMDAEGRGFASTPFGSAQKKSRFKLTPKRDAVLGLLDRDDLYPFATFTPPKVSELLVPKYGREKLLPLFDIQKTEFLLIKRPSGSSE